MRAIVIRRPGAALEAWELVERPIPTVGPGQVWVRVHAASLNNRDLMIARGVYGGPLASDLVPLADGAGEVVALGAGVTKWKVGDRVASSYFQTWHSGPFHTSYFGHQLGARSHDGMLAEYVLLSEHGIVSVPAHLSYEEAATLPCAALTAWSSLAESANRPPAGGTVLVQGTGGVSIFASQLALARGLRVLATTSSDQKARRLRELGVDEVINYREHPAWHDEVLRRTDGEGVDHIIEVGGAGTLASSLQALKPGGTIALIGLLTGLGEQVDPMPILFRGLRVEGIVVGSVSAFENMNRALSSYGLRPVLDEVFPLERARDALTKLAAGKHFGKLVVRVSAG
jgi:NADPH:quinone reductase-like Zn-dependent oxidoreductase